MRHFAKSLLIMLVFMVGCQVDRHSSAGFRLPPDGDVERGKAAFVTLGCNNCHQVEGANLPQPSVRLPVPVVLGGLIPAPITDGHLVTSIIYPAAQRRDQLRMPHYDDRMTVRQLTDVVAFLQSTYTVERPLPEYYH
jgi:sulfur-oxidizing protein SoxX